jgi:hypothetical protein
MYQSYPPPPVYSYGQSGQPVYVASTGAAPAYSYQQEGQSSQPPNYSAHQHIQHAKLSSTPISSDSSSTSPVRSDSDRVYRDLIWGILFFLQLITVFVAGFICYSHYKTEILSDVGSSSVNQGQWSLVALTLLVASFLGSIWLYALKYHTAGLVTASLYFGLLLSALAFVLFVVSGQVIGAVFMAIMFLFQCLYVYSVRSRIPFTVELLLTAVKATETFPHSYTVVFGGFFIQFGVLFAWSVSSSSIIVALNHSHISPGALYCISALLILSFYWTMMTINNTIHTIISGVSASWYFLVSSSAHPKNVVWGSIRRACTFSFGSIALGSLIVAVIRTLRVLLNNARSHARGSQNMGAQILLCCAECLLSIIEGLIAYINKYAFSIISIYGKPYFESASQAWDLLTSRGLDAVINDSLVDGVTTMMVLISGIITAIFSSLVAYYSFHSDWRIWLAVGLIAGIAVTLLISEMIESTVLTLFVCLAMDPAALARTKPEDYHRITSALNDRGFGSVLVVV